MPNLKDIKRRIGSVVKTKQITSAMKLVAGAKLKKATDRALAAQPYKDQLAATLAQVAQASGDDATHPLLQSRDEVTKIFVVVLCTDRGLCGPFNNGLLRKFEEWLEERDDLQVELDVYGRKGRNFLAVRDIPRSNEVMDYGKTPKMDLVRPLTDKAVAGFVDGEFDEVWLMSNKFVNALTQKPQFERILPMSVETDEDVETAADEVGEFRYEPDAEGVLGALLPLYLRTVVLQAFLETEAGEYAARMTAMDNATRNASDLIDRLTLQYNRARQAAITTEITEIVSGAEALNG